MLIKKSSEIEKSKIVAEGAEDVWIRWLIGEHDAPPNFYLRLFEVEPGGHTPAHAHSWEHEVFILEGKGKINTPDASFPVETGFFALISPNDHHQFENTGNTTLKFLCVIPREGK
jgi:quercetin dioxygenase-like cupin family protein